MTDSYIYIGSRILAREFSELTRRRESSPDEFIPGEFPSTLVLHYNSRIALAEKRRFPGNQFAGSGRSSRIDLTADVELTLRNVVVSGALSSRHNPRVAHSRSSKPSPAGEDFVPRERRRWSWVKLGLSTRENVKATTRPLRRIKRIGVGPRQCGGCHRRYWLCGDCGGCCCCCCWLDGEPLDCWGCDVAPP